MKYIFLTLFFYSSYSFPTTVKKFKCNDEKDLPKETVGCEGEACGFFHYDRALSDITLYEKPSLTSKKVADVKKCEELKNLEPVMITKTYGKVKITRPTPELEKLGAKAGDIVPTQQYGGEGYLFYVSIIKETFMQQWTKSATPIKQQQTSRSLNAWIKLSFKDGIRGYAPRSEKNCHVV